MTTTDRLRRFGAIVATACAVAMGNPLAHGQELPAGLEQGIAQGISQGTAAVEQATRDLEALQSQLEAPAPAPVEEVATEAPEPEVTAPEYAAPAPAEDPNYQWRTDPASKALAGKPLAPKVLHRVPGSYHDAPRIPEEAAQAEAQESTSLYGPGTPIYVGENMCTVAAAGYDEAGRKVALTSGHCGAPGTNVSSADSPNVGASGTVVSNDKNLDYSVIELGSNAKVSRTYNGTTVNTLGAEPRRPGQVVCKSGVASGRTCGATFHDWQDENISQVCAMPGDSGAPLVAGDRLVGIVAGGIVPPQQNLPCYSPLQGAVHGPTRSSRMDSVMTSLDKSDGPGRGFTLPEN